MTRKELRQIIVNGAGMAQSRAGLRGNQRIHPWSVGIEAQKTQELQLPEGAEETLSTSGTNRVGTSMVGTAGTGPSGNTGMGISWTGTSGMTGHTGPQCVNLFPLLDHVEG